MSKNKDEWIRRYLDGELRDEEESKALHMIADDPELRELLKLDMQLRQKLASDSHQAGASRNLAQHKMTHSLPDGFADRVMEAIDRKEGQKGVADTNLSTGTSEHTESHRKTGTGGFTAIKNTIWQPRPVMWRPAWSAGIAAAFLMLLVSIPLLVSNLQETRTPADIPIQQITERTADRVMMRFVYVDNQAESIAVAGDFSDWEPIPLNRHAINGDVAWTGIIPLPRGEHRYMFIKDGDKWTTDPLANRFVDDGFGNRNAVINL